MSQKYKGYWNKRAQEKLVIDKLTRDPWAFPGLPGQERNGLVAAMDSIESDIKAHANEFDMQLITRKGKPDELAWRRMFRNIVKVENEDNDKGALAEGMIAYEGNGNIVPGAVHPAFKYYEAVEHLLYWPDIRYPYQVRAYLKIIPEATQRLLDYASHSVRLAKQPAKITEPPAITDQVERMRADTIEDAFTRLPAPARARILYDLAKRHKTGTAEGEE